MDRFSLVILLGNDAMQTGPDVAEALRGTASMVELDLQARGSVRDRNGNTVGTYGPEQGGMIPVSELAEAIGVDTSSSASRQHFIDTGRYLTEGEDAAGGDGNLPGSAGDQCAAVYALLDKYGVVIA